MARASHHRRVHLVHAGLHLPSQKESGNRKGETTSNYHRDYLIIIIMSFLVFKIAQQNLYVDYFPNDIQVDRQMGLVGTEVSVTIIVYFESSW